MQLSGAPIGRRKADASGAPAGTGKRRAGFRGGLAIGLFAIAFGWSSVEAASLPSGAPTSRSATTKKIRSRGKVRAPVAPVVLFHVNHRETIRLRMADEKGRPPRGVQGQVNRFLRCHYTKRQYAMNPRLTRLIYETGRHFAGRRIEVVSGYRHPRVAKNPRSPHMKGLACDMRVVGVKNTELRDFFRQKFKNVGVGYYPNSSFVHLDVRRGASAFWIDYSGPGETALYARDATQDLLTGRADRWRRTTIHPSWPDWADDTGEGSPNEAPPTEGDEADVEGEGEPDEGLRGGVSLATP